MHRYRYPGLLIKTCITILCTFSSLVLLFLFPLQAAAHTTTQQVEKQLSITIELGFNDYHREDFWTPAYITMESDGADFQGTLSVNAYKSAGRSDAVLFTSPWHFEQPVKLHKGTQEKATVYVPLYLSGFSQLGIMATLLDNHKQTVATANTAQGYAIPKGKLLIGTMSNMPQNLQVLDNFSLTLPGQTFSLNQANLDADSLPTTAVDMANFDMIILDNFASKTLKPEQILALETWVNQGGVLVEVGGAQWQKTLGALPKRMVPVNINGVDTIPQGTRLIPETSPYHLPYSILERPAPTPTAPKSTIVSTATLSTQKSFFNNETLLASGNIPLMVKARQGQGTVFYLAFDPISPPLDSWDASSSFWPALLFTAFGDKFLISVTAPAYAGGPGEFLLRGGILNMITPQTLLGPWIIVALLIGYLLILGPIRLLIIRHMKQPHRGWRIIMSGIVIFSLLSYGLAYIQKGASLTNNSVSIIQFNQGTSSAHITTFMGIFVPNQGNYNVHIPAQSRMEPIPQNLWQNDTLRTMGELPVTFTNGSNTTDIALENRGPWTFNPLVAEQDRQLRGGLTSSFTINENHLIGTLTNTLPTALSDLYVLLPNGFASIGHLAAGETKSIDQPFYLTSPGEALADQIAKYGGLTPPYFPYTDHQSPQNDFQRHMALLSSLSGNGFSYPGCNGGCPAHSIMSRNTLFITGGQVPPHSPINTTLDPLLLSDSSATLIGWADQDLAGVDNFTINGKRAAGMHENFIEMPLSLETTSTQNLTVNAIPGQVVDIQSDDAQLIQQGIYSLATGGITFELPVPSKLSQKIHNVTVHVPDLLANPAGGIQFSGVRHLQASLYNWQTGTWDTITLDQNNAFTTANTAQYLGPDSRTLIYITKQKNSVGAAIFFGRPSLTLR